MQNVDLSIQSAPPVHLSRRTPEITSWRGSSSSSHRNAPAPRHQLALQFIYILCAPGSSTSSQHCSETSSSIFSFLRLRESRGSLQFQKCKNYKKPKNLPPLAKVSILISAALLFFDVLRCSSLFFAVHRNSSQFIAVLRSSSPVPLAHASQAGQVKKNHVRTSSSQNLDRTSTDNSASFVQPGSI